ARARCSADAHRAVRATPGRAAAAETGCQRRTRSSRRAGCRAAARTPHRALSTTASPAAERAAQPLPERVDGLEVFAAQRVELSRGDADVTGAACCGLGLELLARRRRG